MIVRTLFLAAITVGLAGVSAGHEDGHGPVGTASAATSVTWADIDCGGSFGIGDPLQILQETGGIPTEQAQFCPIVGSSITVDAVPGTFGDVNCDGAADARDALVLIADLAATDPDTGGCPDPGVSVELAVFADALEIDGSWRDYGDAPDGAATGYSTGAATGTFPTQTASGGPEHAAPFAAWLGELVSLETAPNNTDAADDGLMLLEMHECDTSLALISLNVSGMTEQEREDPLFLNVFADYNRDGDWDDAGGCSDGEHVLVNLPIDVSGDDGFTVAAPAFLGGAQVDEFWMRLALTTTEYTPGAAGAIDGETEDYLVLGGQPVEPPAPAAAASATALPQGGPDAAGHQFNCRGGIVGHGSDRTLALDIEQTLKSKTSGFTIGQIRFGITQITNEKREATNVATFDMADVDLSQLIDGRIRARLTLNTKTTQDPPDRMQGPFVIDLSVEGKQQNGGDFGGVMQCAFYVDHTGEGTFLDPNTDGFQGGPGRLPQGLDASVKFIAAPHNKVLTITSDSVEPPADQNATRYDKDSIKVYGPDGALLAANEWDDKAGVKKIKTPASGRALQITPVKDDRGDHQVERIIIRIEGRKADNTKVVDYYRIVIVHEKGKKLEELIDEYNKSSTVAFYLDEGQADVMTYIADGTAIMSQTPPFAGVIFDDATTVCDTTNGQQVHSVFHGSLGFVVDYAGLNNSDAYYRAAGPVPDGPCPPASSTNVTNFGPSSPFYILDATACDDKVVFSEYNTISDTFRLGAVQYNGSGLGPVAGGDSYRDASCFMYNLGYGLVGSTPGAEGRSNGGFVPLAPCNALCEEGRAAVLSLPAPKVILPADAPNVHMRGLVVSPDGARIAWYRTEDNGQGTTLSSHVWMGDFDADTQTINNHEQLTTEGFNFDPTWSPDGSQIAFGSGRDGNLEIYIMNADGSEQTNFTNTPDDNEFEPSWQVP